jgi:hypothetical protein
LQTAHFSPAAPAATLLPTVWRTSHPHLALQDQQRGAWERRLFMKTIQVSIQASSRPDNENSR